MITLALVNRRNWAGRRWLGVVAIVHKGEGERELCLLGAGDSWP